MAKICELLEKMLGSYSLSEKLPSRMSRPTFVFYASYFGCHATLLSDGGKKRCVTSQIMAQKITVLLVYI